MTVSILGLPVQNVTMEQAVDDVYSFFGARESKIVVTPNAEILQMYVKRPEVRSAMLEADYVVPDGIGAVSYTHLDVYKRQPLITIPPGSRQPKRRFATWKKTGFRFGFCRCRVQRIRMSL